MSRWDRVSELFGRALELPADERAAFVEKVCAGDDELLAELRTLLAAYSPARTFFADLEAGVVGPSVGRLLEEADTVPRGTVLGSYEIEDRIGGGGMGVVYRARDRKLDRTVAVKLVTAELARDPVARDRFLREARAAAALDDSRICAIHAIEETPDGRLFLVMPYYAGQTLKQCLARGGMRADRAVELATEVAEGLSRAHRAGIVHRDIKPANVLITNDSAVKILDFGLAKLGAGEDLTRSGTTVGTAAYMAPEQIRGGAADPRSDVWSLGVVLYEMLAGQRPFRGETEPAILYHILEGVPDPLRTHAPMANDALAGLVERMLAKDPALRPADAGVVASALRRLGDERETATAVDADDAEHWRASWPKVAGRGTPASGRNARTGALLGLLLGRRRRVALAAMFAVLVASAAFIATLGPQPPAPVSGSIAVLPFDIQGDPELDYLRAGMVHLLSTKLDGIGALRAVDPHALLASLDRGARAPDPVVGSAAAARFGAQAFILGAVLRVGTGVELSATLYGPTGEQLATASAMAKVDAELSTAIDELAHELVAHRLTDVGATLSGIAAMTTHSLPALRAYLEGEHLLLTSRPTAARTALGTAVELDSTFGLAWYRLARAAGWVGPVELNEDAAERAVRLGGLLPARARALVSAYRVFRTGDPLEAERLYRRILASYPDDMETLLLLGETLFHNNPFFGRTTLEARQPFEKALALDPGNREVMVHLMDLAAARGHLSALDSLSARYPTAEPGDEPPIALHAYSALRSFVLDGPAGQDQAISGLVLAGPDAIFNALVRVAPQLQDHGLSDRLAELLTDPSYPPEMRASGHLHRGWIAVARGRWRAADAHWEAAETIQPGWTLLYRVLVATVPHSPASRARLDSLSATVQDWSPPTALEDGLHEGDGAAIRTYLLGLLAWRAGEDPKLIRAIRDLTGAAATRPSQPTETGGTPGLASALGGTLRALDHWRAGRQIEALAALDRAELRIPFHRRARSPLLEQHLNRFVRAEALRALGEQDSASQTSATADEEALRWYASLEDGYFHWGAPFVGPALVASARIHERQGRLEQAAAAYERFLTLWADADPELASWLDLASERLEAITDSR